METKPKLVKRCTHKMSNSQNNLEVLVGKQEVRIQHLQEEVEELKDAHTEASRERKKMSTDLVNIKHTVQQIDQKLGTEQPTGTKTFKLLPLSPETLLNLTLLVLAVNWMFGPEKAYEFLSRILGVG